MKILFLASRLHPDKTSCGLLACKLLSILEQDPDFYIEVITFDPDLEITLDGTNAGRIKYLTRTVFPAIDAQAPAFMRLLNFFFVFFKKRLVFIHNKLNALVTYSTGLNFYKQYEVWRWVRFIEAALSKKKYDVIYCYGAGHDFFCHLAMTKIKTNLPWIANYHDPYPGSLYPPPYRVYTPIISNQEEKGHREILERATFLAFPGIRLRDWIVEKNADLLKKSYIIPHAACALEHLQQLPEDGQVVVDRNKFTILHTGTLLSARNPLHLINAFNRFLSVDPQRKQMTELMLIGNVNAAIQKILDAMPSENIKVISKRLSYSRCIELSRHAAVLLVIEAQSTISPFFPGKLTDYLWLEKPIVSLSPELATVRDILGDENCSRIDDENRIVDILERLWTAWSSSNLQVDYSEQLKKILPEGIRWSFKEMMSEKK